MPASLPSMNDAVFVIVPEVILLATVCVMILLGPFLVDETSKGQHGLSRRWTVLAILALVIAGWAFVQQDQASLATAGPFVADGLTYFVRLLTFTLGPLLVLLLTRQIDDGSAAEAHACLLAILAGANFVALASDLIGLFLALELVSIPTYIFLYLPRRDAAMQEATIKYFLLSIFSSSLVLFGMSWLFGAVGTTDFEEIATRLSAGSTTSSAPLVQVAVAMLVAGLSFRIAAAPFHFYAPDVFQGVNSVSAAMLSVAPKIAGFAALMRVLSVTGVFAAIRQQADDVPVQDLLAILAILTMTIGTVLAVRQKHLHRLMAYSSIANAGYMLVGLSLGQSSPTVGGVAALWFYLAVYGLTTIGLFALLAGADAEYPLRQDDDLVGLSQIHPTVALMMAICLFGLTGLPPAAGFSAKLNLVLASWSSPSGWGRWLAGALAINAAIGAWYYLRLIALMYRDAPSETSRKRPLAYGALIAGSACAIGSIVLFVAPQRLWDLASAIAP